MKVFKTFKVSGGRIFLLLRERKTRQKTDKDMGKLKYELSLKSIQMVERIEKLQEENDLLKIRSEKFKPLSHKLEKGLTDEYGIHLF